MTFTPDRPIESDPEFQRLWGDGVDQTTCPVCKCDMVDYRDFGKSYILCPHCDLHQPLNNEVDFFLRWYGMDEYQSFDNGLVSESRKDMAELQVWWSENFHWEIREYQSGKYVEADILDGNDAGQWFIYSRGYQIGCITEKQNG
jgi:hypothetical protein